MESSNSYVCFSLIGDDFDPKIISKALGIEPTGSWRKGDKGEYIKSLKISCWEWSTEKGKEYILIDNLVTEVVLKFQGKIDLINQLKSELQLNSVLEIVMDIDVNPEVSTPALGHDMKTIEFLFHTNTITDVDIYKFDSTKI